MINSPECVEALQTMVDFVQTDGVMPSAADMGGVSDGDMFLQGNLGMLVSGIWMFSAFEDAPFAWDIVVEPGMATQATHFLPTMPRSMLIPNTRKKHMSGPSS
ncbi:MAG: hypothetical protein R3C44_11205 [Chloroflexota bacterium]